MNQVELNEFLDGVNFLSHVMETRISSDTFSPNVFYMSDEDGEFGDPFGAAVHKLEGDKFPLFIRNGQICSRNTKQIGWQAVGEVLSFLDDADFADLSAAQTWEEHSCALAKINVKTMLYGLDALGALLK